MRLGSIVAGLVGAVAIGVTFWLALFGFVQMSRPSPVAVGPGVAIAPAPVVPAPGAVTGQAQAQAPAAAGQTLQVKIVAADLKFDLKEIKAAAGQQVEVTLENKGVLEHDFALDQPAFKVVALGGKTAKGTFTAPAKEGTYEFYCSIPGHKESGMVGKLIVGPGAGATAAPAAAPAAGQATAPKAEDAPKPPPAPAVRALPLPAVAPLLGRTEPTLVKAEIESREVTAMLDDGVAFTYWTFGGTVPGPMLRVMEGDTVELTFKNAADSKVTHSIDLHAVTGPGGGAKATQLAPGESATFRFKALNPGVYVYHCATPMVAHHIASGMYGLIVVEPKGGLPKVDREYYVMQGDFYLQGAAGEKGLRSFSVDKMLDERPDYVLFNGSVGALTKENALKAKVGETVRIFFGVGGPNLTSSFHVIGEIFDRVHPEGSHEAMTNIQTTLVPTGGATMAEFKVDYPGDYVLVDHSLGRLQKGGAGILTVEGAADPGIFDPIKPGAVTAGH